MGSRSSEENEVLAVNVSINRHPVALMHQNLEISLCPR